jgi:hypothetical protein
MLTLLEDHNIIHVSFQEDLSNYKILYYTKQKLDALACSKEMFF